MRRQLFRVQLPYRFMGLRVSGVVAPSALLGGWTALQALPTWYLAIASSMHSQAEAKLNNDVD
jgi:hypothetical protein